MMHMSCPNLMGATVLAVGPTIHPSSPQYKFSGGDFASFYDPTGECGDGPCEFDSAKFRHEVTPNTVHCVGSGFHD